MLLLIVYRTRDQSFSVAWSDNAPRFLGGHPVDNSDNETRYEGDIRGRIEGPYRDDASLEHDEHANNLARHGTVADHTGNRGSVVPSSRLSDGGNEWRDAGNAA